VAQDLDYHKEVLVLEARPWDGQISCDMLDQEIQMDFEAPLKAKLFVNQNLSFSITSNWVGMGHYLQLESCIHGTFWDKFMITNPFCPGQIHIYIGKAGGL